MRGTLNTLKPDSKILTSILLLLLFLSCQSNKIESASPEISFVKDEYSELLLLPELEKSSIVQVSDERVIYNEISGEHSYELVPLVYYDIRVTKVSDELIFISPSVYAVPPLAAQSKPKAVEVKTVEAVNVVKKKQPVIVSKVVKNKEGEIKEQKKEKKTEIKVKNVEEKTQKQLKVEDKKISSVVSKKDLESIIDLPEMNVVSGVSFTVEMDQSGWLYESESSFLEFKNKFYTNDRVLFEFVPLAEGDTDIVFSKYTSGKRELTKIPISIGSDTLKKTGIKKNIKPEQTISSLSVKEHLEHQLEIVDQIENPDEVYFKLAGIYMEEGYIKKSKEFYEYVYDNYPLSLYYEEAREKMDYILDNFLLVR